MVLSCAIGVQPITSNAAAKKYVKSVSVSSKVSVAAGAKKTIKVKVKVAGKASKKVKVKSSNKKIVKASYSAKKSTITLTGVKKGNAKVTVTTVAKNKKNKVIKKTIKVTVTKKKDTTTEKTQEQKKDETVTTETKIPEKPVVVAVSSILISDTTAVLLLGDTLQLTAKVQPDNATDKTLTWSSSDDKKATVDNNGLVKGIATGTAVIKVSNAASGKSAECTVTIKDIVTVTTQSELDNALGRSGVSQIIIDTQSNINIPSGNYPGTALVVKAAKGAVVTNNAVFESVTLSGGSYNEKASYNDLLITAASDINISSSSSAGIVVALSSNKESENVNIINNGIISDMAINSAGTVSVTGDSSAEMPIPVNISKAGTTLKSNQNLNINASAKASIVLTGDTDKTIVTVDKEDNLPNITGVGYIPYTVTENGGKTGTIVAEASDEMAPVDIKGVVNDAYSGNSLSDVNIYLIPYSEYSEDMTLPLSGDNVTSSYSDGGYEFKQVNSGNYYLIMVKDGYKKAIQLLTASSRFNSVYENEVMELLDSSKTDNKKASISGVVKDASTGEHIQGIIVELRINKGNIIDPVISSTTTDSNGSYSFSNLGLEADQYTLNFKDERATEEEKFIVLTKNVCVKADEAVVADVSMSKPVKGNGVRFVLTWESEGEGVPSDLDAHLFMPASNGLYKEVYYSAKYYSVGTKMYAMLDVDDTNFAGPETATIYDSDKGLCYFYVYNYTHAYPDEYEVNCDFTKSGARVDVYSSNKLLTSYNVPVSSGNTGDWWKVCSYNTVSGDVTGYNQILDTLDMARDNEVTVNYISEIEDGESTADYMIIDYSLAFGLAGGDDLAELERGQLSRELYNSPETYNVGLNINSSYDTWEEAKNHLIITMEDGYTYSWRNDIIDGVDDVLNIVKDGEVIGYYYVYYNPDIDFSEYEYYDE